jgi:hypothetical protein
VIPFQLFAIPGLGIPGGMLMAKGRKMD